MMMRKMIVGFSHNRGPLSYLIRFMTGTGRTMSPASHCFTAHEVPWSRETGQFMVSEAQGLNVHYTYSDEFLRKNSLVEVYEILVPVPQFIEAEKIRVRMAGVRYGFVQLLGYLWVILLSRFRKHLGTFVIENPLSDGDRSMVCVEYVMRQLGLSSSESWTPEHLRQWCSRVGKSVSITEYLTRTPSHEKK